MCPPDTKRLGDAEYLSDTNVNDWGNRMSVKIFPNLPVKDVSATIDFFTKVGFSFNEAFTNETAAAMVVNDDASVMLVSEQYFADNAKKQLADTSTTVEATIALGAESRQRVDEIVDAAVAAGGQARGEAADEGFMYNRSFHDLDGHIWEVFYMDLSAFPGQA